jgi:hypothetical protein
MQIMIPDEHSREAVPSIDTARLVAVPAKTLALFFGDFFQEGKRLWAAILGAGRKNGIEQGNGSYVGGTE